MSLERTMLPSDAVSYITSFLVAPQVELQWLTNGTVCYQKRSQAVHANEHLMPWTVLSLSCVTDAIRMGSCMWMANIRMMTGPSRPSHDRTNRLAMISRSRQQPSGHKCIRVEASTLLQHHSEQEVPRGWRWMQPGVDCFWNKSNSVGKIVKLKWSPLRLWTVVVSFPYHKCKGATEEHSPASLTRRRDAPTRNRKQPEWFHTELSCPHAGN